MGQNQEYLPAEYGRHSHGQRIGTVSAELEKKQAQPKPAVETAGERMDWRAIRNTLWTENVCVGRERSTEQTEPTMNANPVRHKISTITATSRKTIRSME
jgi:hypothetical protein